MTTRTLLLTPWYFPYKIVRWDHAIKMKYEGTADVIAEYNETVSSPSITWKIPSILRLHRLIGRVKKGVKFSRINVYTRDSFRCQYCGNKFAYRQLSYDHVVPRAAGGRTTFDNIVTACRPCNSRKDKKTCDEAGMWPLTRPVRPKTLPFTPPIVDPESVPEEWKEFLGMAPA